MIQMSSARKLKKWDALLDAQKELVEEKRQVQSISDVTQVMLPRMIRVIRTRSVRMSFL